MADTAGDLSIRRAGAHDRAVLTALAWRLTAFPLPAWRTPGSIAAADARDMLNAVAVSEGTPPGAAPDAEVFIAERDRDAVGCLHMLVTTDFFGVRHAHISVIATTEAAEGSGVGRALIVHAEAWARQRGLTLLTLNVFAANGRARQFYEKAGFAPETLKYVKPL